MQRQRFHYAWLALGPAIIALLFTGCGSAASAANSQATPACPTATNFMTVTGVIATIGNNTATVTTAAGTTTTVLFTTTTRFSKLVAVDPTTLASGTTVQVVVAKGSATGSVIAAQTILVQTGQSAVGGGNRGGNGSGGRSFNPACRTQKTPVSGQKSLRGVRGSITAVDPSLKQITVTDTKGNSYVFALTSTTVVATQAKGSMSDLAVGDTITATGQQTANGLQVANVQDAKTPIK